MKIIFLDFDGPLVPNKCIYINNKYRFSEELFEGRFKHLPDGNDHNFVFDSFAVDLFNNICELNPDVYFVLHTSWRKFYNDDWLKDMMKHQGLNIRLHEDMIAPFKFSSNRWQEIYFWLHDHPDITSEQFIILDDENPYKSFEYKNRIVKVDCDNGISYSNVKKMKQLLGIKLI